MSSDPKEDLGECRDGLAIASFTVRPAVGPPPLTVSFSARVSRHDLDCGELIYRFGFDGMHYMTTTHADVQYTFTQPGSYLVTVTAATDYQSVTTQPVVVYVGTVEPIELAPAPIRLSIRARAFAEPTTTFSLASKITAEAVLFNPGDEVGCRMPYMGGPKATFRLYDAGVEVARSGTGVALMMEDYIAFPPGETTAATSTLNDWKTPTWGTFALYPGTFTIDTVPVFTCRSEVISKPLPIVVVP